MPERVVVETDGVDFGWVMQVTFVITITLGSLLVALLSLTQTLPTWTDRALFAVRVGAIIWIFTAVPVYLYARRRSRAEGASGEEDTDAEENDSVETPHEEPISPEDARS